jgi:hypothetical protein
LVIEKQKGTNHQFFNQFPAEMNTAMGKTIRYEIHTLIISVWNMEKLPEEWKEAKTDCSKYKGVSLLQTTYKILSNIPLSILTPFGEEIIWDHQCGFRHKSSTTDDIFCIRQILKKWEHNEAVYQQFVDFRKAHDSVKGGLV